MANLKNKGVIMFPSYFIAASLMPSKAKRYDFLVAIYNYSMLGEEPKLDKSTQIGFELVRPIIDKTRDIHKGGNPKIVELNKSRSKNSIGGENAKGSEKVVSDNISINKAFCKNDIEAGKVEIEQKNFNKNAVQQSVDLLQQTKILPNISMDKDMEIENEKKIVKSNSKSETSVPTLGEIENFAKKFGLELDFKKFYNYYANKNWEINDKPIRDWRKCLCKANNNYLKELQKSKGKNVEVRPKSRPYNNSELEKYCVTFDSIDSLDWSEKGNK